eukprot:scpid6805/ scgid7125/ 
MLLVFQHGAVNSFLCCCCCRHQLTSVCTLLLVFVLADGMLNLGAMSVDAAPVLSNDAGVDGWDVNRLADMLHLLRRIHDSGAVAPTVSTASHQSHTELLPVIVEAFGVRSAGIERSSDANGLFDTLSSVVKAFGAAGVKRVGAHHRRMVRAAEAPASGAVLNDGTNVDSENVTTTDVDTPTEPYLSNTTTDDITTRHLPSNSMATAKPISTVVTATTVVVRSEGAGGVNLKVFHLLVIVCAVFLSGFIVGGLSVWLMAARRRKRGTRAANSEVVANPIFEQSADGSLQPRHPSLRALPSTISAITHRFHRPGFEEGYFVPDEGWAVITANINVEDMNIPIGSAGSTTVAGALEPTRGRYSHQGQGIGGNMMEVASPARRSPEPSDRSLPAIEYSESLQRLAAAGNVLDTRQSHFVLEPTPRQSFEDTSSLSVVERVTARKSQVSVGGHRRSAQGRSCSLPDANIPEQNISVPLQDLALPGDNVEADARRHSVFKSCTLRRVSSDNGIALDDLYRDATGMAGGHEVEVVPPSARASRDAMESQSEPGSPAAAATAAAGRDMQRQRMDVHRTLAPDRQRRWRTRLDSGSAGGACVKTASDWQAADTNAATAAYARPADMAAKSHVSAPPGLGRAASDHAIVGYNEFSSVAAARRDQFRLSPMNKDRVLSWIESQENILQSDFDFHPSSPISQSQVTPQPHEPAAANTEDAEVPPKRVGDASTARSKLAEPGVHYHRSLDETVVVGEGGGARGAPLGEEQPGTTRQQPLREPLLASQTAQIMYSTSTGVMFPAATQTLESIIAPHPLASPPDEHDQPPTAVSSYEPRIRQRQHQHSDAAAVSTPAAATTTAVAQSVSPSQRRTSLRPSVTRTDTKTAQRLSMHPVDVMELDHGVNYPTEGPPGTLE